MFFKSSLWRGSTCVSPLCLARTTRVERGDRLGLPAAQTQPSPRRRGGRVLRSGSLVPTGTLAAGPQFASPSPPGTWWHRCSPTRVRTAGSLGTGTEYGRRSAVQVPRTAPRPPPRSTAPAPKQPSGPGWSRSSAPTRGMPRDLWTARGLLCGLGAREAEAVHPGRPSRWRSYTTRSPLNPQYRGLHHGVREIVREQGLKRTYQGRQPADPSGPSASWSEAPYTTGTQDPTLARPWNRWSRGFQAIASTASVFGNTPLD